jgi:D-threonate/D-erythronate kinase
MQLNSAVTVDRLLRKLTEQIFYSMIAVIADDFTGAAEIGGFGLRHGLKVVIETNVDGAGTCDLLVIAADTRSLSKEKAALEISKITRQLKELKPRFIFKKLDSVLRGNIAGELEAQLNEMGLEKAIVVAGNPYFDRMIKNGKYTVRGIPLAETFFANDPEFPIHSSVVTEIIGESHLGVYSCKVENPLPDKGLLFGDVTSMDEMGKWAERIDETCIAAGGSGFFSVLLKRFYPVETCSQHGDYKVGKKSLFIFGSMYPKSRNMLKKMNGSVLKIMNMPEPIYCSSTVCMPSIDLWADEIGVALSQGHKVVVVADHPHCIDESLSVRIKENMGFLVLKILEKSNVDNLLIEGGATTSAILNQLNVKKLYPFKELDLGIIQMKVDGYPDLCITTKPGSYAWPQEIWEKEIQMAVHDSKHVNN